MLFEIDNNQLSISEERKLCENDLIEMGDQNEIVWDLGLCLYEVLFKTLPDAKHKEKSKNNLTSI